MQERNFKLTAFRKTKQFFNNILYQLTDIKHVSLYKILIKGNIMSIRSILKTDLDNLLEFIENQKRLDDLTQLIDFDYFLQLDDKGEFEYEGLRIENKYVIDPLHYKKDGLSTGLFQNFIDLKQSGSISVRAEACSGLAPYLHDDLGLCDFKLSVDLSNISLHEAEKPFRYKTLAGWVTADGPQLNDVSADYTFLVKNFRVMQDFI